MSSNFQQHLQFGASIIVDSNTWVEGGLLNIPHLNGKLNAGLMFIQIVQYMSFEKGVNQCSRQNSSMPE